MTIERLQIDTLRVTKGLDMGGSTLVNARFQDADLGNLKNLKTDGLTLLNLATANRTRTPFVSVDLDGEGKEAASPVSLPYPILLIRLTCYFGGAQWSSWRACIPTVRGC